MSEAIRFMPSRDIATGATLAWPMQLRPLPPALSIREAAPRRTKIWEFSTNLHCSIIGTCLTAGELRQVLRKLGFARDDASDHDLHKIGVTLAGRHDDSAKRLHKTLDLNHKLAINQFAKAETEDQLHAMWRDAVRRGDIPGCYWATLTHPLASRTLIADAFGDVHMLSHLVGAANRADIRRLCVLEAERTDLEQKLQRQQLALHEAVVTRDRQIAELRAALAERVATSTHIPMPEETAALHGLIGDMERRLTTESRRRASVETQLAAARAEAARERAARAEAERNAKAMQEELERLAHSLAPSVTAEPDLALGGLCLLYVGGRPNQVAQMRPAIERLGGLFLHHDGGLEQQLALLAGLASRSDLLAFPVDCISHEAANAVKALCGQSGKRYLPLRSASITSLLAALRAWKMPATADAAD